MKKVINRKHFSCYKAFTYLAVATGLALSFSRAAALDSMPALDPKAVTEIQKQLGLSEAETRARLHAEAHANNIHQPLQEFLGDAYAGAWFDVDRMKLAVAYTEPRLRNWIKVAGAYPVLVKHNRSQLLNIQQQLLLEAQADPRWLAGVSSWYIDDKTNSVVLEALPEDWDYIAGRLPNIGRANDVLRLKRSHKKPQLNSDIRGGESANGCSVGFSVVGGFVWAGHCGLTNDTVENASGQVIGSIAYTTAPWGAGTYRDHGWVQTTSGWTPQPVVQGYSDGLLPVKGQKTPIQGMSVCRYGASSQAPFCGSIHSTANTIPITATASIEGLSRVNIFSFPGDSGGPYLTAAGDGLGTHSASLYGPTDYPESYFEPLSHSLTAMGLTLLTTTGNNPPNITGFTCPDYDSSGNYTYFCSVSYATQGPTQVAWSSLSGTGAGDGFFGSCLQHQWVTVSVTVSNAFGSSSQQSSFTCPTGIIP